MNYQGVLTRMKKIIIAMMLVLLIGLVNAGDILPNYKVDMTLDTTPKNILDDFEGITREKYIDNSSNITVIDVNVPQRNFTYHSSYEDFGSNSNQFEDWELVWAIQELKAEVDSISGGIDKAFIDSLIANMASLNTTITNHSISISNLSIRVNQLELESDAKDILIQNLTARIELLEAK